MFLIKIALPPRGDTIPVVRGATRIPYAIRDRIKPKLDEYVQQDILEKVEEPNDRVNSAIFVEKRNGDIKPCLNLVDLSFALKPNPYPIPTQE